jgi:hypothetical protein
MNRMCPNCHVALVGCLCWCMALPPREAAILPDMHIHPAEAPVPLPPQVLIVATTASTSVSTGWPVVGPLTITLR